MPRKTRKVSRKRTHRTLRRIPRKRTRKGGADSQSLTIPSKGFEIAAPVNSDNAWYKIA